MEIQAVCPHNQLNATDQIDLSLINKFNESQSPSLLKPSIRHVCHIIRVSALYPTAMSLIPQNRELD